MKKLLIFVILICFVMVPNVDAKNGAKKKIRLHPSFAFLLKTQPRDKEIINPMVPRISAKSALSLYRTKRAIFIAAGGMAVKAKLPGAIPMTPSLHKNPMRLKKIKGKIIVIFCH